MRASDIGGVGGPAATPAPGPSPQRHRLPLLPPLPAVWAAAPALIIYCNKTQHLAYFRGSVVQAAAHYPQGTGFDTCQLHF